MRGIGEYLENPTISKITRQEKNQYLMSHINIMDLLKRIEFLEKENKRVDILEQQTKKYKESELVLIQKINSHENEINGLKATCTELEKRIQKYEVNKQIEQEALNTTILANEQREAVSIGEIIKLGKYEEKEIKWQVLDINEEDNLALVISKYVLFRKKYSEKILDFTWETSPLRNYLNNDFYSNCFTKEEQTKIVEYLNINSPNEFFNTDGKDTKDKVFLLSIDEINNYFHSDSETKASFFDLENGSYWLRSHGSKSLNFSYIYSGGSICAEGDIVTSSNGIRPAMWVCLNENKDESKETIANTTQKEIDMLSRGFSTITVNFGKYRGTEIEWQVLDRNKKDGSVLLVSKYVLGKRSYNEYKENIHWEESTLRKYLNTEFYSECFSKEEQTKIKETYNMNFENELFYTEGGSGTKDKVFLLSADEIKCYFDSNSSRIGVHWDIYKECFWTRSPGSGLKRAAIVNLNGEIDYTGYRVCDHAGLRPAMWVNLESRII